MSPRCLGWLLARISLIDIGQFDAFVRHLLNDGGRTLDFGAIVPVGWRDV